MLWQLLQNTGREVYQAAAPAMITIRNSQAASKARRG